jgi:hypothetical protein
MVACDAYEAEGFKDDDEVLLVRIGETRRALKLYKRFTNGDKPSAEQWAKAMSTLYGRACEHGFSGGCPLVQQVLEEPFRVRYSVAYLCVVPLLFTDENGDASEPCSVLPHFVEMLVTRAVGCYGYAVGGVMRSPPGEAYSHSSHGKTMMRVMREEAVKAKIMFARVASLVEAPGPAGGVQ